MKNAWENRNCKMTLAAFLVYGGAVFERLAGPFGVIVMLVGIWKIKGWFLKVLGIAMIVLLGTDESQEAQIVRALYFFGAFYLTWYIEGQRSLLRKRRVAWERDNV
jgi:hypothetical protein